MANHAPRLLLNTLAPAGQDELNRIQELVLAAYGQEPNLGPRLAELTCPIFVMWGLDDEFCPASHGPLFLDACSDIRLLTFGHTGHWVQVERQAEFNSYATEFLHEHR